MSIFVQGQAPEPPGIASHAVVAVTALIKLLTRSSMSLVRPTTAAVHHLSDRHVNAVTVKEVEPLTERCTAPDQSWLFEQCFTAAPSA